MNTPKNSEILSCRHCYNVSQMEILGDVGNLTDHWDDPNGLGIDFYDRYELLKCPRCSKINIRIYKWNDFMDGENVNPEYEYIYPKDDNIPEGLPKEIAKAYAAAEIVRSADVNAYATLLRRLLEIICIDKKATGATLAKKLQDLANKNEIPQNLVEIANGLRNFGNIGAHAGIGDLSAEEIPLVKALIDALLEYLYSAPHLALIAATKLAKIKSKKTT